MDRSFEGWTFRRALDHGFVQLVDAMPHWCWGPGAGDQRVVDAARVSFAHLPDELLQSLGLEPNTEERTPLQNERLLAYLLKNKHTSPFEKVRFEFLAKLPIFVARQWIRHRMGSFSEVSARYTQLPREFYIPEVDRMMVQSDSNKQASGAVLPVEIAENLRAALRENSESAYIVYEAALKSGLARELARMALPLNVYTMWYWTVDLHNLMHFLRLRLHEHAQYEIRVYGEAILEMASHVAPATLAYFRQSLTAAA